MIFSRKDNGAKGMRRKMLRGHGLAVSESRKTSSRPAAHMVSKLQQPNMCHNTIKKIEKKMSDHIKI
jgi:hypothetical protein